MGAWLGTSCAVTERARQTRKFSSAPMTNGADLTPVRYGNSVARMVHSGTALSRSTMNTPFRAT
eukprot:9998841-Prorocentrum_lima.AAC.1